MQLWLNRTGDVSLREQLVTQIRLSILCRAVAPGHRLPSTRDLARRFGIHANTVSAAYRELEKDGWLEFRHGSGVFVRAARNDRSLSPELAVDQLIGELAAKARRLGVSEGLVKTRLRSWLALDPPARWMLIEPDPELRRIVICEMEASLTLPVTGCGPEESSKPGLLDRCMATVLPSKAAAVRKLLPAGVELTVLRIHPVAPALGGYLPAPPEVLVGIASRWTEFQRVALTMLIAVGLPPESLLVRDASKLGWKRGLEATTVVVCDVATESELPANTTAIVFRLLDETAIAELRTLEARHTGDGESEL